MNILVDTPIWSLALRRRKRQLRQTDRRIVFNLEELIRTGRAEIIGPVRQEIFSGVRSEAQFESLRQHLQHFSDVLLSQEDYEEAARCNNVCRQRGVQGTATGFLLCAVAIRRGWSVFTTDDDFHHYVNCLPLVLHQPEELA